MGRSGRGLEGLGLRDAAWWAFSRPRPWCRTLPPGATSAGGLFGGLERETAARFSFLLSVPAVLGAGVLDLAGGLGGAAAGAVTAATLPPDPRLLVAAAVTAAASGYVAVRLVLASLRAGRLGWFALYCWALGVAALLLGRS